MAQRPKASEMVCFSHAPMGSDQMTASWHDLRYSEWPRLVRKADLVGYHEQTAVYPNRRFKSGRSGLSKILLKKSTLATSILAAGWRRATVAISSSRRCHRYWEQSSKFTEVLGCCCKVELVFCAVGTSKTQAVELQDSFKVREQHLDLLSLAM